MAEWRPFRLTLRLATPIALNHPWLHLDGLILHLIYMRVLGRDYYTLPTKRVQQLSGDALGPFKRVLALWSRDRQHEPLTCASVSFFEPPNLFSLQYFKRFEQRGAPKLGKVNIGSGHYRNWMLRTVYVAAETCTFYGRGDIDLVRDLLSDLTHVGNDTRAGWGKIAAIEIVELDRDRSLAWQGKAMRPIPIRFLREYDDAVPLAWRPPYWAAANVELCAPPGAQVKLL